MDRLFLLEDVERGRRMAVNRRFCNQAVSAKIDAKVTVVLKQNKLSVRLRRFLNSDYP